MSKYVKPPKTVEQEYLEAEGKSLLFRGAVFESPAVNYLGRGSYPIKAKMWKTIKDKADKIKKIVS